MFRSRVHVLIFLKENNIYDIRLKIDKIAKCSQFMRNVPTYGQ